MIWNNFYKNKLFSQKTNILNICKIYQIFFFTKLIASEVTTGTFIGHQDKNIGIRFYLKIYVDKNIGIRFYLEIYASLFMDNNYNTKLIPRTMNLN